MSIFEQTPADILKPYFLFSNSRTEPRMDGNRHQQDIGDEPEE